MPGKKLKDRVADALDGHAYTRWSQLEEITTTWRGSYGYLTAWLTATESIPLCRIQYLGDADDWAFALYQASTSGAIPHTPAPGWPWSTATTTRSTASTPRPRTAASPSRSCSTSSTSWDTWSAPRGAVPYPPAERGEIGGMSLGLTWVSLEEPEFSVPVRR